ncbi:hypothetical protein L1049_024480 [Liquidambar formosana]|uniref:Bifunctional inhibitor/plant lipid transfer protein/seed storage helical domain-containing protein n=1 Tax=Liquidambar formosana TaxID=63359 RepID=A0AAP0S219_LIQFO
MPRYVAFATVLLLVTGAAMAQTWDDPSCADVVWYFLPCMNFLQGLERKPTSGCCNQLKDMNKIAKGKKGRRRICQCIQYLADETGELISSRVHDLSGKCSVHRQFPISNHVKCTT